jgi:hypothetical protein
MAPITAASMSPMQATAYGMKVSERSIFHWGENLVK